MFKAGDKVQWDGSRFGANDGTVYTVDKVNKNGRLVITHDGLKSDYDPKFFKLVEAAPTPTEEFMGVKAGTYSKPDGGPSAYYDFPFKSWVTVNDMIEYLSEKQWGKHSWIFKDIIKACTRWGSKDGTTQQYDAKKIIYYGARLLMSVSDKGTLRAYLQQLLDDKQFRY